MTYRGWHGVTDAKHILIAVSYEPTEGTLACKMCSGEPVIHLNVPEAVYQSLLRNKFAGSYYRKHVRPKYPVLGGSLPAYQPKEKMTPKKHVAERSGLVMTLFGEDVPAKTSKRSGRS